jgi:aryl-alcohol dehydrogenase-like predicted oxidoreductase
MRKEMGASWGFSAPTVSSSAVLVERSTVEQLKNLLSAISSTFRDHGMFDLAAQADDVAALL